MPPAPAAAAFGRRAGGSGPARATWPAVAAAGLVVCVLATVVWSAVAGTAPLGRNPVVFTASVVLEDERPLTVVDVATAEVAVRLPGVYAQVGASTYGEVQAVAADGGTYLVDRRTGAFNLLGADDFIVDGRGPGIGLGDLPGAKGATGLADGADLFVVRDATRSTVSLVDRSTVVAGSRAAGAGGVSTSVAPVGFVRLDGRVDGSGPDAVVADGALWLLVGVGDGGCRLEQVLPPLSPGAPMGLATRARLAGGCDSAALAAVGRPTSGRLGTRAPGTGRPGDAPVVALAVPGEVQLFTGRPGAPPARLIVAGTARATSFVPARGVPGAAAWLAGTPTGWLLVRVDPGRGVTSRGVAALGPAARPAPPAFSGGALYTLDRAAAAPQVVRIDPVTGRSGAVAGASPYPSAPGETAAFTGAEVIAVGPRVVVNNPASLLAVVVFTDGSHPPVTVDKRSALDVSASGPGVPDLGSPPKGAPAPARADTPAPAAPAPLAPTPSPVAPVAVDPQATCATTPLRPYAPRITSLTPSSVGALVTWTYALLDEQDCEPQTWTVAVQALGGAPPPAQPVQRVDGQQQLQIGGLRPATTYQVVVTAYLAHASTPSAPTTFTTAPQGPDAPTAVRTSADGHGHWDVTWSACDPSTCVVPADSWTVTGTACDGSYVGTPPSVTVPAGTTGTEIDASAAGLLGTSLRFSVQGATASGLRGPAADDGSCTQAWQPPDTAAMSVAGAAVPAGSGTTLTATLTLTVTGDPAVAFGGSEPQIVYTVGDRTVGPTSQTSVTVPGLAPGASYTPQAKVWSAGHEDAAVTLTGRTFTQTVPWPTLALHATGGPLDSDPNQGDLSATVTGLPTGTYSASGTLACGHDQLAVAGQLQPGPQGEVLDVGGIDLTSIGGACSVTLALSDGDSPNPYGVASPPVTAAVQLGTRPPYQFSASYVGDCVTALCAPAVTVSFHGAGEPAAGGVDWTVTATDPSPSCAGADATSVGPTADPQFPVTIPAPPCADLNALDVTVSFRYLGATVPVVDAGRPTGHPAAPPTTTTTTTATTTTTTSPSTSSSTSSSTTTPTTTTPGSSSTTAPRSTTTTTTTTTTTRSTVSTSTTNTRAPAAGQAALAAHLAAADRPGAGWTAVWWVLVAALVASVVSPLRHRRGRR
ncbi:MAG TPA: fibronectin type III domain-containing protein [Acidimicrobiales bacterium]|nr:fibronectin type III domain-containing protein [Acidimicrobiales bacterium]